MKKIVIVDKGFFTTMVFLLHNNSLKQIDMSSTSTATLNDSALANMPSADDLPANDSGLNNGRGCLAKITMPRLF